MGVRRRTLIGGFAGGFAGLSGCVEGVAKYSIRVYIVRSRRREIAVRVPICSPRVRGGSGDGRSTLGSSGRDSRRPLEGGGGPPVAMFDGPDDARWRTDHRRLGDL